jgi:AcrR family transcriptional regulator
MKKNKEEKQRILKLVNELFYRNGLYKTSMDEIAAELKISKKTIYKYFDSKYDLVMESTRNMLIESGKKMDEVLRKNEDLASKLVHLMENYSNEVCTVSEKWIKDMRTHYPEIWKEIEDYRNEKIYVVSKKLIKMGAKEKILIDYPPELIIESYASTMRAIVNPAFLLQCKCTMQQAIDFVFNIHLNGILTPKGRLKYNEGKKKIKKK